MNCSTAAWGCIDCKKTLFNSMNAELEPIRERAAAIRADESAVDRALDAGKSRAGAIATETIATVQLRMGIA